MSREEYASVPVGATEVPAMISVTTKLTLKGSEGGAAPPGILIFTQFSLVCFK